MDDLIGQVFGNYRLIRLLGRGGFAHVYLGEHIHLQTQVAIKVLSTQLVPKDLERFRREAKTVASLDHLSSFPSIGILSSGDQHPRRLK